MQTFYTLQEIAEWLIGKVVEKSNNITDPKVLRWAAYPPAMGDQFTEPQKGEVIVYFDDIEQASCEVSIDQQTHKLIVAERYYVELQRMSITSSFARVVANSMEEAVTKVALAIGPGIVDDEDFLILSQIDSNRQTVSDEGWTIIVEDTVAEAAAELMSMSDDEKEVAIQAQATNLRERFSGEPFADE